MLIMAGTNDLVMGVAPGMVLHSIQALHAVVSNGRRPHSGVAALRSSATDVSVASRLW